MLDVLSNKCILIRSIRSQTHTRDPQENALQFLLEC